jgi:hypothetical protein
MMLSDLVLASSNAASKHVRRLDIHNVIDEPTHNSLSLSL